MNAQRRKIISGLLVVIGVYSAAVMISHAQTSRQRGQSTSSNASQQGARANMDAEREKLWNSPNMLRARAWLQDYCSKSAKVTPQMAKQYQQELANMSTSQLKLWLLKFDHEEEQRSQQQTLWQQAHASALSQAVAANKATQKSYADINKEQSEAAGQEQQQINEQREFSQSEAQNKELESVGPYPYNYPGYGGTHYHYHLYPYGY